MNNIWFTSDQHYDHKKIIEYEKEHRPFATVEEMNEKLIENHNSLIKKNDTVYHLGDFCFSRESIWIAKKLNGKHRLIMGNHDCYPTELYLNCFEKLHGAKFWEDCIMTHIPVHELCLVSRSLVNLHGHLHGKKVMIGAKYIDTGVTSIATPDLNYKCVSVEQNNLFPIHADIIRDYVKRVLK